MHITKRPNVLLIHFVVFVLFLFRNSLSYASDITYLDNGITDNYEKCFCFVYWSFSVVWCKKDTSTYFTSFRLSTLTAVIDGTKDIWPPKHGHWVILCSYHYCFELFSGYNPIQPVRYQLATNKKKDMWHAYSRFYRFGFMLHVIHWRMNCVRLILRPWLLRNLLAYKQMLAYYSFTGILWII